MSHKFFGLVTLAYILLSTVVTAQSESSYTFSQFTRPYEALGEGKNTVHSGWQYSFNRTFSLPFVFKFWGYNREGADAYVNEKGQVWLTRQYNSGLVVSAAGTSLKGSAAWQEGFVYYYIEGAIGKRIAIIEYEHVGFQAEDIGRGYISFQIWFYEENNTIEMHYGPRNFELSDPNLIRPVDIGVFMGTINNSEASVTLTGDPASPTIGSNFLGSGLSLTEFPKENTVYKFTPDESDDGGTRINQVNDGSADVVAWYAPEQRSIEIRSLSEEAILQQYLYTIDGKRVMLQPAQSMGNAITRLNVSGCSAGLYLLHMETAKGRIAKKIYIY